MCKAMEDMKNEAALEARLDERKEVAYRLVKMDGRTLDKIAEIYK